MFKRRYSAEEKYEILTALGNEHSTHEIRQFIRYIIPLFWSGNTNLINLVWTG